MTESPLPKMTVVLADDGTAARIQVDLESFLRFSQSLDQELDSMVRRWQHVAAPATKGIQGRFVRPGRARHPRQ